MRNVNSIGCKVISPFLTSFILTMRNVNLLTYGENNISFTVLY